MQTSFLNLHFYPEKILKTVCAPVMEITDEIKTFANEMLKKMYASSGVGLAAPQVGRALQIICIDVSENQAEPLQLINPRILEKEGQVESTEGCLSLPGLYVTIARAKRIRVSAQTLDDSVTFWADDLLSICLQHEIDHLYGKTMLDHLSPFKRERALAKFRKLQASAVKSEGTCR